MNTVKSIVSSTTQKVDGAEGVSESKKRVWFVAIVNNHSEKKYSDLIHNLGYDVFVPIQKEERIWKNGTVKEVDRILIPATIFIHCTESERIDILKLQFAKRFMVDQTKQKVNGKYPIAIIPDFQIESFRKFIEQTEETIELLSTPYKLGESIKVIKGKLKGLIGNVVQYTEGKAHLIICLGFLGCAKLKIDTNLVTRL